jgi:hypothetical protein
MDALDYGYLLKNWAKEWMSHTLLSATVHFLACFLVNEGDGDVLGEYAETLIFGIN